MKSNKQSDSNKQDKSPVTKTLKILNSKERKHFFSKIEEQWAVPPSFFSSDDIFLSSAKDRIYLMNREFENIAISKLKIDSIGMYFATINATEFRLSIEGSQIVGKVAKKNVFEISKGLAKEWMQGKDIEINVPAEDGAFVILKNGSDYLGCGKYKQNLILNFVPKTRRVQSA